MTRGGRASGWCVAVTALAIAACTDDPAPVMRDEVERGDAGPRLRDAGRDGAAALDTGPRPDARSCALEDRCGNLVDDDCDGEIDEGCTLDVTVDDRLDGRTFGGTGGTAFSRVCYPGQVARGLHGSAGLYVDRIGLLCARIEVLIADEGEVRDYKLAITPTVRGVLVGGEGGSDFELGCPDDQVLGGIFGAAGAELRRIGVECVRPVITDDGEGNLTIRFEPGDRLGPEGGSGGTSFSYDCAPTRVAMGMRGRTGLYVDAFGISCQRASATDPDA